MLPLHHGLRTDDPDRTGIFGLATRRSSLLSYVRVERLAGIEPASFAFARQRSSAELQACEKPPAGIEPAPRPYKGRVLAVDTTEARAPVARALRLGRQALSCALRGGIRRRYAALLLAVGVVAISGACRKWRCRDSNPRRRGASAVLFQLSYIPKGADGSIRTTTARDNGVTARRARQVLSVRKG